MNLVIDIGNTQTKLALFDHGEIKAFYRVDAISERYIGEILLKHKVEKVSCSNVSSCSFDLGEYFSERGIFYLEVNINTPLPIGISYDTPQSLGIDRLMAAVAAVANHPNKELLVIDMGSAITIDRISASAVFLGGNISLGMGMRFKALHEYTSRLPLCRYSEDFSDIGTSTENAILGGVALGIVHELQGYIDENLKKNEEIAIIFTGGDAKYFVNKLKNTIFAEYDLLLQGLNIVLEYNYEEN